MHAIGEKHFRLTLIAPGRRGHWICLCDCGTVKEIYCGSIFAGRTRSCGCFKTERDQLNHRTHGHTIYRRATAEYTAWSHIKKRCGNPNDSRYPIYGGRGITICEHWRNSFEAFLSDVGRRPNSKYSIERIDTNGNYNPENCKWATQKEQQRNRRNNLILTINGASKTLAEWSEISGIKASCILARKRKLGWPDEKCVFNSVRKKKNNFLEEKSSHGKRQR